MLSCFVESFLFNAKVFGPLLKRLFVLETTEYTHMRGRTLGRGESLTLVQGSALRAAALPLGRFLRIFALQKFSTGQRSTLP